ncbi:MAG: GyrI-like domain-containing protein [Bacteroidota bacterium]
METTFISINEKYFIGQHMTMSLAVNRTGELWRGFMPRRREISNPVSNEMYSLQVYPPNYFYPFNPTTEFEKWALIEVNNFENIPSGMEKFVLPQGDYAVFQYKGDATNAAATFQYIFNTWLPASGYQLDHRPHFEILGEKYKNNDPDSEEEIWIPIKS